MNKDVSDIYIVNCLIYSKRSWLDKLLRIRRDIWGRRIHTKIEIWWLTKFWWQIFDKRFAPWPFKKIKANHMAGFDLLEFQSKDKNEDRTQTEKDSSMEI